MQHSLMTAIAYFGLYFFGALIALMIFKYVYALITPHDEWALIKDQQNTAAAIGFSGSILGFAIALSGAITNSASFIDFCVWAVIALLAQSLAFGIVRFVFMKRLIERIEQGEQSAAIMLASISIAVGILNAACMTY